MKHSKFNLLTIALLLTALMLFIAACSSSPDSAMEEDSQAATEEPAAEEPATEEPAAEEPAAEEPAAEEPAAEQEEFSLQWWGSQDRHERTIATIDLFKEEHPEYDIVYEFVGWGDYWTSLATKGAGGNLPDVIQQDYARFFQFAEDGLLIPLNPYIESGVIDLSSVPDTAIEGGRIGDDLFALSLGTNSQSYVIDLDIFEEAGVPVPEPDWTWADFEETVMAIHEATGKYGISGGWATDNGQVNALYLSLGSGFYSDDGKSLGFTDNPQPLIDHYAMIMRLQDAGAIPHYSEESANPSTLETNKFVTGDAAMYFAHTNQFVALSTAAGEDRNLMMLPVPRSVDATQSANFLKPSMFFSLTSQGNNPDAGAVFIDYFTNSIEANEVLAAERGVPISTAVGEAIKPIVSAPSAATFDFLANLDVSPIRPPDPTVHGDIMTNIYLPQILEPLLFEQITPEEAVALFIEQANALLASSQ